MQYKREFSINLPDFMIVGTAKSGTTSIHHYLKAHPDIFLPEVKETWFFHLIDNPNKVILDLMPSLPTSFLAYVSLFEEAKPAQKCGEITPSYLHYYDWTIKNIKQYHPDWQKLKIIIILREPVEKIISHYNYVHRRQLDPDNLSLLEALKQEEERMKTNTYIPDVFYVDNTRYYKQVKAYLDNFEQVKIFLYDDLKKDQEKFMQELYEFIEVKPIAYTPARRYNKSKPRKIATNPLAAMIVNNRKYFRPFVPKAFRKKLDGVLRKEEQIEPEAITYLQGIFKEEVQQLENLIGKDLSKWLAKYP